MFLMSRLPTLSAAEIAAEHVVLRKAHESDRLGLIELQTDPLIRTYLGGPRPRSDVEQYLDFVGTANMMAKPGSFVIADKTTNHLIGTLMLDRRPADQPGHLTETGGELELSYVLRHSAWARDSLSKPPQPSSGPLRPSCPTSLSL